MLHVIHLGVDVQPMRTDSAACRGPIGARAGHVAERARTSVSGPSRPMNIVAATMSSAPSGEPRRDVGRMPDRREAETDSNRSGRKAALRPR